MSEPLILGLDLSLRATGAVLMRPGDTWDQIKTLVCGSSLKRDATEAERLERIIGIERALYDFLHLHGEPDVCVVEQYAFSKLTSQAHALGELGGFVKTSIHRRGIKVVTLEASRARACLGKFPRKDTKTHVHAVVRRLGAPEAWGPDVWDAWVIANGYCVENGHGGVIVQ